MRSKEYYKSLILSHAEEIKESIYIIFSPIFFGLYIIFGAPYKAFAPTGRQAWGHEYPGRMPWARSFCPFRAWGEWQGCGRGIAVRSTRRLAGGIQAKEEVRYDSPRRGFQWGHFCLFSLLFSCIQTKTTIKSLKFHKINVWYSTLSYILILPFNT